jgi:hypothetical protein
LKPRDVRHVLLNGFKSAFLPFRAKGEVLARALAEMDGVFETYLPGAWAEEPELL